jgi:hypothetical protein
VNSEKAGARTNADEPIGRTSQQLDAVTPMRQPRGEVALGRVDA